MADKEKSAVVHVICKKVKSSAQPISEQMKQQKAFSTNLFPSAPEDSVSAAWW